MNNLILIIIKIFRMAIRNTNLASGFLLSMTLSSGFHELQVTCIGIICTRILIQARF